jgi:hypothetical protein
VDNTQVNSLTPEQMQQVWSFLASIWVFFIAFWLVTRALSIWFFWRIFAKAGYNGAISLVNLIGWLGGLICVLILAFGTWPNEQRPAVTTTPVPTG